MAFISILFRNPPIKAKVISNKSLSVVKTPKIALERANKWFPNLTGL